MGEDCQHQWAEHSFAVSARVTREGSAPSFAVATTRLQRCARCRQFLLPERVIAQRVFGVGDDAVSDVMIRLTENENSS
jgi:hypothetical protein